MKELRGSAGGVAPAPLEECVRFFLAVDRYPAWHPEVVRSVEVLERDGDGDPARARAKLHVAVGPLVKDFDLVLAVTHDEFGAVRLTRVPHAPGDGERFEVTWRLAAAGDRTRIRLEIAASLSVPRLVPVTGIGERMAQGFVSAATKALAA